MVSRANVLIATSATAVGMTVLSSPTFQKICGKLPNTMCPDLKLDDFDEKITVSDDGWNHVMNGERDFWFYTKTDPPKEVAHLNIRLQTGQIGWLMVVDDLYRERGLEQQLVKKAEVEVRAHGTARTMWEALVSKEAPWYANDPRFTWKDPAHESVTGDGWSMDV